MDWKEMFDQYLSIVEDHDEGIPFLYDYDWSAQEWSEIVALRPYLSEWPWTRTEEARAAALKS